MRTLPSTLRMVIFIGNKCNDFEGEVKKKILIAGNNSRSRFIVPGMKTKNPAGEAGKSGKSCRGKSFRPFSDKSSASPTNPLPKTLAVLGDWPAKPNPGLIRCPTLGRELPTPNDDLNFHCGIILSESFVESRVFCASSYSRINRNPSSQSSKSACLDGDGLP